MDEKAQLERLYIKAVQVLSGLNFETSALDDPPLEPQLENPIHVVAAIFDKSPGAVIDDLIEQRQQEIEEQRADDELRYGNLDEYGQPRQQNSLD